MYRFKLLITLVIGLIVGFSIGYFLPNNTQTDTIVSRLEQSGLLNRAVFTPDSISLGGSIQSIGLTELNIKVQPPSLRNVILGKDEIRIIKINSETKFVKLVAKSDDEFAKENEEFRKSLANPSPNTPIFPPTRSKEVPITFSDIKIGNQVTVISDKAIEEGTSVSASKIILYGPVSSLPQ